MALFFTRNKRKKPIFVTSQFFFLYSLILSLLLTGCFRHCYRGQPYNLYQTDLSENVDQALTTHAVTTEEFYYEAWWEFFQDPQLNKFIELSLECHPDILEADARIRFACNEAGIARSELFPHFFAIGTVDRQKLSKFQIGFFPGAPKIVTETILELQGTYELDIWQRNRSLFNSALSKMQAIIADYEEAKLLLSTTIAAFYFDLQMTLARIEINRERLRAKEELYKLQKQRFDLGIVSEFRFYEVHTDMQLIRDLIFVLENQVAIDQHALAALVGNVACPCGPNGEVLVKPAALFDKPFPLPATLPIDLLARRPDITARKWLVESACFDIKAARANFFPRIDLMGLLGFNTVNFSKIFTGDTLIALGQATGTLPLFLGGKLCAQLGVARESFEIAIQNYNQTVLIAVQQVSDALSSLVYSDKRKVALEEAVRDAEVLLDLTRQRFEHAVYNKLTLLNAEENLYIQQDLEIQVQLARFESAVKLIRAIGGGYYEYCPSA